jgi:predicted DNA-binding transcriptional regulator YafY
VGLDNAALANLGPLRAAADQQQPVHFVYLDLQARRSERRVHPLGCFFWGQVWTLAAWCTQRQAFRSFRLDRISELQVQRELRFEDAPGQRLADFFRAHGQPADGPSPRHAKAKRSA